MKTALSLCFFVLISSCSKDHSKSGAVTCNIEQVYLNNAKKVTITNGVWGTVSSIEGNCMPSVPACNSCCRNCPVKRTVKIYQYTTLNDVVTNDPYGCFFDAFTTPLVAEVNADENGFFQANIPAGHYSIVIVENGKLYSNTRDGQVGIGPFSLTTGAKNVNLFLTYNATF